ncbi:MAG TPA: hypothetical protein VN782_12235 [Usitatibacter sp.]|nr:hypothetical protein [Usitatibacter sp.]
MSYADRLKAQIGGKGVTRGTDKTDKTPFVSSVGSSHDPFSRREATPTELAQIRGLLIRHLGPNSDELDEAMAVALRDPAASLRTLRASFPPDCTYAENAVLRALEDFAPYMSPEGKR